MDRYEIFRLSRRDTDPLEGARLTRVRMEAEEAQHYRISGSGSCAGFDPGRRFYLLPDMSAARWRPIHYFLTEVRHAARDPSYFNAEDPAFYSNTFACIPAETPFRPELLTPKPVVHGYQTALVTGPSGPEHRHDQYGRVKLLFLWTGMAT